MNLTPPFAESIDMTSMSTKSPENSSFASPPRVEARGKFLWAGDQKLWVKGVTYGTFAPDEFGQEYKPDTVQSDFESMTRNGINAVRTYTVPPRWLLDSAAEAGLRVMVGLPWEQHLLFLDDRDRMRDILSRVKEGVQQCENHPGLLCFAVGNEIPASIVRWYGAKRVEGWIERLYKVVKTVDPGSLVTYVNYPSTEYLHLPFLDIFSFNVYLEDRSKLDAYLARLQNLAGERPLLLAEVGLDSQRNGEDKQASTLEWQIQSIFSKGSAGLFVFSWTDEWYRGGAEIDDWDFGLTTRTRAPKPALAAVAGAFSDTPFFGESAWPSVSVVVCSYNGARTLADCLDGLAHLDYPDIEVIVIDDGSTDSTSEIASEFDVKLIRTKNHGLSAARNTGMEAASGEIVAYTDDDARPDPDWLKYLALSFQTTEHVAIGGPNIAPPGDGPIAACVANAPGGPVHVLLNDETAEHIPGCNMAFRRDRLLQVGGFDPRFRSAGDDVDLCWRLQDQGWTIGYNPAAMVWHHRRNSVRTYWKQQIGYGKAEALLEDKWPNRYNALGHVSWSGQLYGNGWTRPLGSNRGRIYQGTWGQAPFQSLYQQPTSRIASLPLMPEWWLLAGVLGIVSLLGVFWKPALVALPLLLIAIGLPMVQAWKSAKRARFPETSSVFERWGLISLAAGLHLAQPIARLRGRIGHGLTPWRHHGPAGFALPIPRTVHIWSEEWRSPEEWLGEIEENLIHSGAIVGRGQVYDRWDLEIGSGPLSTIRLLHTIEVHSGGKQMATFSLTPHISTLATVVAIAGIVSAIVMVGNDLTTLAIPVATVVAILVLTIVGASRLMNVAVKTL